MQKQIPRGNDSKKCKNKYGNNSKSKDSRLCGSPV
jgi:hypothetical protein